MRSSRRRNCARLGESGPEYGIGALAADEAAQVVELLRRARIGHGAEVASSSVAKRISAAPIHRCAWYSPRSSRSVYTQWCTFSGWMNPGEGDAAAVNLPVLPSNSARLLVTR